jgi:WD40 repeat protein
MNLVGWTPPPNDPSPNAQADGGQSTVTIDAPRTPLPDGPPGLVHRLSGHAGNIQGLSFSIDGKLLVSLSEHVEGSLKVWDVESGKIVREMKVGNANAFALHPDGQRIAIPCSNFSGSPGYGVFDLNTGDRVMTLPRP